MTYDFDQIIPRNHTNSLKYDFAKERGKPYGLLPMWVADMDFQTPLAVREALADKAAHGIFGYSEPDDTYFEALAQWFGTRHNWTVDPYASVRAPGVVFAICTLIRCLTQPGDAVLIQEPVYYCFREGIVDNRRKVIVNELQEVKDKYADERRTQISYAAEEFNPEDFYADDDMVITISHMGYIKRTALTEFRQQGRGGLGAKASNARDEDFIEYVHTASMHSTMMFFTQMGRCYWLKVYDIPEGNKQSKGRAIQNLLNIEKGDKIQAFINVKGLNDKEYISNHYLVFVTKNGIIKKTTLEAYSRPRAVGIIAIQMREDDELIKVSLTDGTSEILIASHYGKVIRFNEKAVRPVSRGSIGVRAITLEDEGDRVVGMVAVAKDSDETILVISENGYGKRTALDDPNGEPIYRVTNRGGKGVKTLNITEKTGKLIGIDAVTDDVDLMLINKSGTAIRMAMDSIRVMGRATQGVKLIELQKRQDTLVFGCVVPKDEEIAENQASAEITDTPQEDSGTNVDTEE